MMSIENLIENGGRVRNGPGRPGLLLPEGKAHPCDFVILRGFEQLYMGIDADGECQIPEKNPSVVYVKRQENQLLIKRLLLS